MSSSAAVDLRQRHLTLSDNDGPPLAAILPGLETDASLGKLTLRLVGRPQEETSRAIRGLLERTPSIREFELSVDLAPSLRASAVFLPICEGIVRSPSVSRVVFRDCGFRNEEAIRIFKRLLPTKSNLESLSFEDCTCLPALASIAGRLEDLMRESLPAILARTGSSLRSLSIVSLRCMAYSVPSPTFGPFLRQIERSKLEQFCIGPIVFPFHAYALTSSIPRMKTIKELEIRFGPIIPPLTIPKREIIEALKKNFCLRAVRFVVRFAHEQTDNEIWDDGEKTLLEFLLDRNRRLAQWVDNPSTVPRHLWPEAMKLAAEAGEDALFRSLQKSLGDEIESSARLGQQRKRKRSADGAA